MYKKQMILQRIVCYAMLVAAALVFIYSLGILTDMYECKFAYYAENYEKVPPKVAGTEIYYIMQGFNRDLTTCGIVLILLAVTQFLFKNHARRKYYIANYITVVVNTVATVVASVWALGEISTYREQYLKIDFAAMKERAEMMKFPYTESTFWFDISSVVFGFLLIATVFNVINLILKIVVMNAEKKLIEAGKEE
ncbi:MAG: hypothetical protein J6B96_02575 [Agathobacter sp.]|nr:hypothetical protein [Agathobacter sp.]